MIKIAICDDEKEICSKVESTILRFAEEEKIKVEINVFYLAQKLLEHMKNDHRFDLIFLDIEMEQLTGIELGNLVRNEFNDDDTRIVYISWNEGHAMDLFRIRPYHFLVKPIEDHRNDIKKIIRDVNEILVRDKQFYCYQVGKQFAKEHYANILFFSSENRVVKMHTLQGDVVFYAKLDQVESDVEGKVFLRIHKSLLINTRHVKRFLGTEVEMDNGMILEISKKYRDGVNLFAMNIWEG